MTWRIRIGPPNHQEVTSSPLASQAKAADSDADHAAVAAASGVNGGAAAIAADTASGAVSHGAASAPTPAAAGNTVSAATTGSRKERDAKLARDATRDIATLARRSARAGVLVEVSD